MYSEKRKHYRLFLTVAITIEKDGKIIRGTECKNISEGGMCISLREKLLVGEFGHVSLTIKCGNKFVNFSTDFCIVWSDFIKSHIAGLEFLKMSSENRNALQYIIDYKKKMQEL